MPEVIEKTITKEEVIAALIKKKKNELEGLRRKLEEKILEIQEMNDSRLSCAEENCVLQLSIIETGICINFLNNLSPGTLAILRDQRDGTRLSFIIMDKPCQMACSVDVEGKKFLCMSKRAPLSLELAAREKEDLKIECRGINYQIIAL